MNNYSVTVPAMTNDDVVLEVKALDELSAKREALRIAKEQNPDFVKKGNIEVVEITNPKDLTIIETKDLSAVLVFPENLPPDFYKNSEYDVQIDKAIELTSGLVYDLSDEGEKKAKADATAINKYATAIDKATTSVFKRLTEQVRFWSDGKKSKVKALQKNRQDILDSFEEKRTAKLNEIEALLKSTLLNLFIEQNVIEEFRKVNSLYSLIKLSALTPTGALVKKVQVELQGIVQTCKAQQNLIETRLLIIANKSLIEGINPPLSPDYLGKDLYADDVVFAEKLDQLVAIELKRREETEARIKAQVDREAREKIEAEERAKKAEERSQQAIREREEVSKKQADTSNQNEAQVKPQLTPLTPEYLRAQAAHIRECAQHSDNNETMRREMEAARAIERKAEELEQQQKQSQPVNGKKLVKITANFEILVAERISTETVINHFKTQLPEKLLNALVQINGD